MGRNPHPTIHGTHLLQRPDQRLLVVQIRVGRVGQHVVLRDGVRVHAQRGQQQEDDEARAVFPRGAVECHGVPLLVREQLQHAQQCAARVVEEEVVEQGEACWDVGRLGRGRRRS